MSKATAASLLCALLLLTAARADSQAFTGNWENAHRDQSGIAHVVISPAGGEELSVRVYGDCHPLECDWGSVAAKGYSASPHAAALESLVVHYDTGFARKEIVLSLSRPGELGFELRTDFHDGSGRHDFEMTGTLRRSAWAGPVGQSWERPPAAATGWGGGARSGTSPPPEESCGSFDPNAVRVIETGDEAKVVADGLTLAQGGVREAHRARDVIRHFRFDRRCRAGKTVYWKSGDAIPGDWMGGADCLYFNPTTAHAIRMANVWKVVDGVQWIADFGTDKAAAEEALALIRFYRLGRECFVGGRQAPVMTYWLTH
jgi:hypothetical protein